MNENLPKVSVVLPTYNDAKYIRQSIGSYLSQTYKNIELIIVDDGSTDETPEIVRSYNHPRMKYFKHETNKGLPCALNTGFAKATGEYLTWTSSDNLYSKDAIEKMLFFLIDKKYSFVYCDFYRFNDNSSRRSLVELPDSVSIKCNHVGACFLYSREVMEITGKYDPNAELAEDFDYWIRVSKKFHLSHLREPLYFFRDHEGSLSWKRHYEILVVDFLIRFKYDILNINETADLFIDLVTQKINEFFRLKKVPFINKALFSGNKILINLFLLHRVKEVLRNYKTRKIDFMGAKLELYKIIKFLNILK